jgi:hypothetical protein
MRSDFYQLIETPTLRCVWHEREWEGGKGAGGREGGSKQTEEGVSESARNAEQYICKIFVFSWKSGSNSSKSFIYEHSMHNQLMCKNPCTWKLHKEPRNAHVIVFHFSVI